MTSPSSAIGGFSTIPWWKIKLRQTRNWPPGFIAVDGIGDHIHPVEQCLGTYCPFHNPSDHHMNTWPIGISSVVWGTRGGLQTRPMTWRACKHQRTHPDPDAEAWLRTLGAPSIQHECDGCCGVFR